MGVVVGSGGGGGVSENISELPRQIWLTDEMC